jgi:hypothetical protein
MKNVNVCMMAIVAFLSAGLAHGYTQGFESGEFIEGSAISPGIYGWGPNSGWGVGWNGITLIDALQAPGVPQAAAGNRYVGMQGIGRDDYAIFNLWQTDPRMITTNKQKLSFDFYLDPASASGPDGAVDFYIRGNLVDTPYYGPNYWGYLKNVKLAKVSDVWTLRYANGGYVDGPACPAGVWHHLEYHFDFSVQNEAKNGARCTLVLDGNVVQADGNVDTWGSNVDPTQLASEATGNPFRVQWYAYNGGKIYVDNFAYIAEPATLSGTVAPANYSGDLGIVGIKVELLQPGTSTVLYTYKMVLSDTGTFSIPLIPQSTYDIAIQGANLLRKVYANQNINSDTFSLNTINLASGDCDGSNGVASGDLSIVLMNMDQEGQ